jgi:hypothetical protein
MYDPSRTSYAADAEAKLAAKVWPAWTLINRVDTSDGHCAFPRSLPLLSCMLSLTS